MTDPRPEVAALPIFKDPMGHPRFIDRDRVLAILDRPAPPSEGLSIGAKARLCRQDHYCDDCGAKWLIAHSCRYGSALCGGHTL